MVKVSVLLLTYNHEQFIGQALDSILSQQVDFAYEVIVGEDCSTDQTRAVVQDYARRYPGRLRPLYHPRNVGAGANARACWAACTGQYVALLEGDDYWTNPLKLARQVAFLDAHPQASCCFHYVESIRGEHPEPTLLPTQTSQTCFGFADFLAACHAQIGSVLLRRGCCQLPDWLFATYPIDMPLLVLLAEAGPAYLLPEVMGRYRLHAAGTWSGVAYQRQEEQFRAMYRQLVAHYAPTRHARTVRRAYARHHLFIAEAYLNLHGQPRQAGRLLRQAARLPHAYTLPGARLLAGILWNRLRQGWRGPAGATPALPA